MSPFYDGEYEESYIEEISDVPVFHYCICIFSYLTLKCDHLFKVFTPSNSYLCSMIP